MLGLLCAAEGEVEVSGEIRVIDPQVTALPIGFGEDPALPVAGDSDAALMDYGVVPLTQQDQIIEIGPAAEDPRNHMVGCQVSGLVAARIAAHAISDHQGAALRLGDQPSCSAHRQHLAVRIDHRAQQRSVAGGARD